MVQTPQQILKLAITHPEGIVGYVHPTAPMTDTDWPALCECRDRGWVKFVSEWREPPGPTTSETRTHTMWRITEAGRAALRGM